MNGWNCTSDDVAIFLSTADRYRSLLDQWKLYPARCRFDIERRQIGLWSAQVDSYSGGGGAASPSSNIRITPSPTVSTPRGNMAIEREFQASYVVPPQIYVRCNFCNQSVAHNSLLIPGVGILGMSSKDPRKSSAMGGVGGMGGGMGGGGSGYGSAAMAKYNAAAQNSVSATGSGYSTPTGGMMASQSPTIPMTGVQRTKHIACPSCRKPLPRCAICLLHMGTPLDSILSVPLSSSSAEERASIAAIKRSESTKSVVVVDVPEDDGDALVDTNKSTTTTTTTTSLTPFGIDLWFTWCQTCRHGGHAVHMMQWFSRNKVCPVSDCPCLCSQHF